MFSVLKDLICLNEIFRFVCCVVNFGVIRSAFQNVFSMLCSSVLCEPRFSLFSFFPSHILLPSLAGPRLVAAAYLCLTILKHIFYFSKPAKKHKFPVCRAYSSSSCAMYRVDRCSMMWNFQTYRTTNFLSVQTDCIFIAFFLLHVYHIKFISFILALNEFLFSECYSRISIADS